MGNYYYNGYEFPELPDWNKSRYPYANITRYQEGDYILVLLDRYLIYDPSHYANQQYYYQTVRTYDTADFVKYRVEDGKWVQYTSGLDIVVIVEYHHATYDNIGTKLIWANRDVYVQNSSTIYFRKTDPIPVPPRISTLTPGSMLAGWYAGRRMLPLRTQQPQ